MPGEVVVTIPNKSNQDAEGIIIAARGVRGVTHVGAGMDSNEGAPNPLVLTITPARLAGHVASVLVTHYQLNAFAS